MISNSMIGTLPRVAFAALVAALTACGGGGGSTEVPVPTATESPEAVSVNRSANLPSSVGVVQQIVKVAERRIGRTDFEYDFRVVVAAEAGGELVTARVESVGPGTTVIRRGVTLGDVPARAVSTSQDLVTLRQDRLIAFDPSKLTWALSSAQDRAIPRPEIDTVNRPPTTSDSVTTGELTGRKNYVGELLIRTHGATDWPKLQAYLDAQGYEVMTWMAFLNAYEVKTPALTETELNRRLSDLKLQPFVRTAQINHVVRGPNGISTDPQWGIPEARWNLDAIGLPRARDLVSKPGQGVKVGVVDAHFAKHVDLPYVDAGDGTVVDCETCGVQDIYKGEIIAGVRGSVDSVEDPSHGMHVAGIIGARENKRGILGVAPFADILVSNAYGKRDTMASKASLFNAIRKVVSKGAKVVNFSSGAYLCKVGDTRNLSGLADVLSDAETFTEMKLTEARDVYDLIYSLPGDVLYVQSAGNCGEFVYLNSKSEAVFIKADHNGYFATALAAGPTVPGAKADELRQLQESIRGQILVVGATAGPADAQQRTAYSQAPIETANSVLAESFLFAPGGTAEMPIVSTGYSEQFLVDSASFVWMYGTSMAAPHVAGVAALLKQQAPNAMPWEIKRALLEGASRTTAQEPLLSAGRALIAIGPRSDAPNIAFDPMFPHAGDRIVFTLTSISAWVDRVAKVAWEFVVGVLKDASAPFVSMAHTFMDVGHYVVRAVLYDDGGKVLGQTWAGLQVTAPPIVLEVNAVLPLAAQAGTPQTFTVTGTGMVDGSIGFALAECEGITLLPGGTPEQRRFTCTFPAGTAPGLKDGAVGRAADLGNPFAKPLKTFQVSVLALPQASDTLEGAFSNTPTPAAPWSFGWQPAGSNTLNVYGKFTAAGTLSDLPALAVWNRSEGTSETQVYPWVIKNTGQAEADYGFVKFPAQAVVVTPGAYGERALFRWTANATGTYEVNARFTLLQEGSVEVLIQKNGVNVFSDNLERFGKLSSTAIQTVNVTAGDVIDFVVGNASNRNYSDMTRVEASLSKFVPPAQPYTKISNVGLELPDTALLGDAANDWGCTRENGTGAVWEVKRSVGPQAYNRTFTFFTSTQEAQKLVDGVYSAPTEAEIQAQDNAATYIATTRARRMCGRTNWEMSTPPGMVAGYAPPAEFFGPSESGWWTGGVGYGCPFGGCFAPQSAYGVYAAIPYSPCYYGCSAPRNGKLGVWLVARPQ